MFWTMYLVKCFWQRYDQWRQLKVAACLRFLFDTVQLILEYASLNKLRATALQFEHEAVTTGKLYLICGLLEEVQFPCKLVSRKSI